MDRRGDSSVRSTTSVARRAIAKAAEDSNARALIPRGEALGRSIYKQTVLHEDECVRVSSCSDARSYVEALEERVKNMEHLIREVSTTLVFEHAPNYTLS